MSSKVTASAAWAAIEGMFASQSRARVIATWMALATVSNGSSSVSDYYAKMKGLANDMLSTRKKIEDEELISYILTGLDRDFDPVVTAVAVQKEPLSLIELYTQLISHENRINMRNDGGGRSSGNSGSRGRGGGGRNGGNGGTQWSWWLWAQ